MRLFSIILLVILSQTTEAQTLQTPTFIVLPCYGAPGLTHPVVVDTVPGADTYVWEAIDASTMLINSQISPITTTVTNVDITYVMAANEWKLCVTAFSACCSSASNCVFILNYVPITFALFNNPGALPGSTADYGIYYSCLPLLGGLNLYWTVTGDITFSNGLQSITTNQDTTTVPLTFGPGFSNGTLCVYTINNFGLSSDTICMNITNSVSLNEFNEPQFSCVYNSQTRELMLNYEGSKTEQSNFILQDISGKQLLNYNLSSNSSSAVVSLPNELAGGVYLYTYSGSGFRRTGKLLIQE